MKTDKFTATLFHVVSPAALHIIYKALEDEATPHEARVASAKAGKRLLTLYTDEKDIPYFQKLIESARNEADK